MEKIRRKLETELAEVHHQLEEAKQTVRTESRHLLWLMFTEIMRLCKTEKEIDSKRLWNLVYFGFALFHRYSNIYFVFKIQDLEATIHKKDMELNDLNARYKYYHSETVLKKGTLW